MKYIKIGITFVIGIVLIGVLSTVIGVITQPKNVEKSVTFYLLDNNELAFNVYNELYEYAVFDEFDDDIVINLVNVSNNGGNSDLTSPTLIDETTLFRLTDTVSGYSILINNDSTYTILNGDFTSDDLLSFTFDVEVEAPAIIKTLLVLIPLVFTASLIGYLSLTVKKGDE